MAGSAQLFPVLQLPKAPSGTWLQDPSYVIWGCKQTLTGIGKITKFRITPVALRAPSVILMNYSSPYFTPFFVLTMGSTSKNLFKNYMSNTNNLYNFQLKLA